jgi:hypothetical protein
MSQQRKRKAENESLKQEEKVPKQVKQEEPAVKAELVKGQPVETPKCCVCLSIVQPLLFKITSCEHSICRACMNYLATRAPNAPILQCSKCEAHFHRFTGIEQARSGVKVTFKNLQGESFVAHCSANETVYVLMTLFKSLTGVPLDQQRMIHKGRKLEPLKNLSQYGFDQATEATVHVVLRLSGS